MNTPQGLLPLALEVHLQDFTFNLPNFPAYSNKLILRSLEKGDFGAYPPIFGEPEQRFALAAHGLR